jgi:DNA-3-methyladenine glycosylase II
MVLNVKKILAESDPVLGKIINTIPEPQIKSTNEVFHDLMSCIIEQQIHYRSTKKIFQKMLDTASLKILTIDNFRQFEEKAVSTVKLSMAKYETVVRIIEFWNKNKINWQLLNDNEVTEKLSSIKGIGKWTIDMILLYTLQRPGVFPHDDFHLKQILISLYGLNPNSKLKVQMIDISRDWGEHKSQAVKYLFAWKEYNKKSSATKNQS